MSSVLPGFEDALAKSFWLHNRLMRDDFPTFDRPINAYSGMFPGGHFLKSELDMTNSAVLIIVVLFLHYQPVAMWLFLPRHFWEFRLCFQPDSQPDYWLQ